MEPINYLAQLPQVNIAQDFLQGLQAGSGLREVQYKAQQEAAALAQAQQYKADITSAMRNPTPQTFASLALKYPQQREAVKQSWDQLSAADQKDQSDAMGQVYSALLGGRGDIAQNVIEKRITALSNAGQDVTHEQNLLDIVRNNPQQALGTIGFTLSHIGDPKNFATQFGALGQEQRAEEQAPADLKKKNADASKATSDATVAASTVPAQVEKPVLENQNTAEQIKTAQQKRRLAELEVQIAQADSETKRGQLMLERDKLANEMGVKQQATALDSTNQLDTINQSLATVDRLFKAPLLNSSIGVGSAIGKALSYVPGTENKDFDAMLDTLKSEQFLSSVKELKGMGALSDAEGKKVGAAIASLDRDQSVPQFKTALGIVKSTLERAQAKVVGYGKLPTTGGAVVMTHPVYGVVKDGDINRLLQQYPGATRQQVIDYLRQSGGK